MHVREFRQPAELGLPRLDRAVLDVGLRDVIEDEGLLKETAGLVEWPVVLMGRIDAAFLDLPGGEEALLSLRPDEVPPVRGAVVEVEIRTESRRDKLATVRLVGEDIEVRPASYVPLDVLLRVCAHPDYWPADLRDALEFLASMRIQHQARQIALGTTQQRQYCIAQLQQAQAGAGKAHRLGLAHEQLHP